MSHDKLIADAARQIEAGRFAPVSASTLATAALAPTLALLDNIAEPAAVLVDMIADDRDRPEVAFAWNRLRIALIPYRAALTPQEPLDTLYTQ